MDLTKDVEISGQRYQIGKMSARSGSWIVVQLITKLMPMGIENQLGIEGLSSGRSEMSEAEFLNIQDHCLDVCRRYEMVAGQEVAMPIMARPGVFAFKELESNLLTILALTVHALLFNVTPFFEGDGLKSVMASFKDLNLFIPSR